LLVEFCRVTSNDIKDCYSSESELYQLVSLYFPAVLQTYGPTSWPQLQKLFNVLVKYNDVLVRKPLAYSLHEVARIIGPQ
jgi:serine/threonine-protein phosphatase 4 regulatory subunit 1